MFAEFLDETMTYSSALFDVLPADEPTLADAQRRKIDRLLDTAAVGPGSRVLEIGTGWGELCIRAAARGAHVRSVTLSAEQQRLARQRVAEAGLSDRVEIDLCDYRDIEGHYDAVLSIEMVEAVGYRFWPNVLSDSGSAGDAGWTGRDSGHHHAAQPDAGQSQHSYLDSEVHLPRRPAAVDRGDHRHHRVHYPATHGRHVLPATALRRDTAVVARAFRLPPGFPHGVGFRRGVPTDVGALPGLLRGRIPVRISRRLPVDVRAVWASAMNFIVVSAASLAIVVVVHTTTFLIGRRIGRYNIVDVAWGVGFVAVAAVAAVVGTGDLFRRILLLVLVAVWGLRLAWHMIVKSAGKGEDPRYQDLLRGDFSAGHVIRKIFLIQGAATWFVSLPLQLSALLGPTPPDRAPSADRRRRRVGTRPAVRSRR